jgi:rare lipoprotein A
MNGNATKPLKRMAASFRGRRAAASGCFALAIASLCLCAQPAAGSPHPVAMRSQTGEASYYRYQPGHSRTASGAPYNPSALTAASRTLPLGAKAKVTNQENGRSVDVTITDRGPFVGGRIMDVSPRAAQGLGMLSSGVSKVHVTPIAVAPTH